MPCSTIWLSDINVRGNWSKPRGMTDAAAQVSMPISMTVSPFEPTHCLPKRTHKHRTQSFLILWLFLLFLIMVLFLVVVFNSIDSLFVSVLTFPTFALSFRFGLCLGTRIRPVCSSTRFLAILLEMTSSPTVMACLVLSALASTSTTTFVTFRECSNINGGNSTTVRNCLRRSPVVHNFTLELVPSQVFCTVQQHVIFEGPLSKPLSTIPTRRFNDTDSRALVSYRCNSRSKSSILL